MKKVKKFLTYCLMMLTIVFILLFVMVLEVKLIPREKIQENIKKSISTLSSRNELKRIKIDNENTYLHVYADSILLNMIYCMDSDKPLESIMESNYYAENEIPSLARAIETESNGNMQYIRYWHGSMMIIRPLLMLLNISQIYYFLAIVLIILLTILFIMLIKKKAYLLVVALIIGLIMTTSQYVPFCLEYVWTYIIMLLTSILVINFENKENMSANISKLMFVTGIITCFLDFLSTETITFTIPILIIFYIRNKEGKIKNIKNEMKQIVKWTILWFVGYAAMWAAKWILSSIILNINSLEYVANNMMKRIVDTDSKQSIFYMIKESLYRNVIALYPLDLFRSTIINISIVLSVIISLILLKKQDKKEIQKAMIVLGIGIIPYIRYITIIQHSTNHCFFTFRAQIATIIAIIIATSIIIDKNKFKKNIEISNKGKVKNAK